MGICRECGAGIDGGLAFCPSCGRALNEEWELGPPPPAPEHTRAAWPPPPAPAPVASPQAPPPADPPAGEVWTQPPAGPGAAPLSPSYPPWPRTSGMAVAGLILAFFCQPLGLFLSLMALSEINRGQGMVRGRGLAVAGVVISAAILLVWLLKAA